MRGDDRSVARASRGQRRLEWTHVADVPSELPRIHGSAGSHEKPRSRAHDKPSAQLHPPAAGSLVRPRGDTAALLEMRSASLWGLTEETMGSVLAQRFAG